MGEKKSLKLSTCFSMANIFFLILVSAIIIASLIFAIRHQALDEAKLRTTMMAEHYFAMHSFFSQQLKPAVFKLTQPSADYFDPVWMSSAYAIKEMNKYIKSNGSNEFYLKDAAINARSPENEATSYEKDFLLELKANPVLTEKTSVQWIDNKPYFVLLQRGQIMETSCLRCHGSPDQAPAEMIRVYGSKKSFYRKKGDPAHVISIRTPLSESYTNANHFSLIVSLLTAALLFVCYGGLYLFSNYMLFKPLAMIRDKALQISKNQMLLGQQIPLPWGQELSQLSMAFNLMSKNLAYHTNNLKTTISASSVKKLEADNYLKKKKEELLKSQEKYSLLFSTLSDPVLIFDAHTRQFIDFNKAATDLYGYTVEEFMRMIHTDIMADPDKYEITINKVLQGKLNHIPLRYHKKKDGTIFPVDISVGTSHFKNKDLLVFVIKDITEHIKKNEALKNSTRQSRFIASQLVAVQEKECKRISMELHDETGQSLTAVSFNLAKMQSQLLSGLTTEINESLTETNLLVDSISEQIHELSIDLRPSILDDLGLVPTIRWHLNKYSKKTGIKAKLELTNLEERLDKNIETTIYRVVQEALNNIIKHAAAKSVTIRLKRRKKLLYVSIEDNGKGFDLQNVLENNIQEGKIGLLGMKERVIPFGGSFHVHSTVGKGTKISLEIPL